MKLGQKMSIESRMKMRLAKLGRPLTEEWKSKIKNSNIGKHFDENNGMWSGDEVGYHAVHDYVKRRLPKPEKCEICKVKPPIDLANISGEYKRDLNDWQYLCRSCHMKSDNRILNLVQFQK